MPEGRRTVRAAPLWLRIAFVSVATFLAAAFAAGLYLGPRLRTTAHEWVADRLHAELALLAPSVKAGIEARDDAALARIARAARETGVRVTVILPSGEVIAESDHPLPLANHADRPEVRQALTEGSGSSDRHSTTVDDDMLYFARRLDADDGRVVGVLRLSRSLGAVRAADQGLLQVLLISGLVGLPIAALVGWLAARRVARPLEDMTAAATRMAAGDFSQLPRAERGDEAGRLAEALGEMGRGIGTMLTTSETGRAELSAILESMAEGVVALDPEQRVLRANHRAAECLGIAAAPAPGTPFVEVARLPELSSVVRAALAGQATAEVDVTLPGAAGRVLAVAAGPIRTAAGGPRGAVLVLRDVTVMRRLERMRLDFVANVSHELRTPLAAMSSAMETVQSLGEEEPRAREQMVDVALRHAKRLGAIVDDLLALSQIESEGDRLERASVPLLRALRQAAASVAPAAAAAGVTISLPRDADDVRVLGHDGRLEQVWVNLLSNAVKYNHSGGSVTVEVTPGAGAREACVTIRDTGQGIPAESIPRIFERFYRVDKGRSRDQGGTGLGLAIVKHIVRAHRGRIEVESRPGAGSTFRVRLPLATA
jgi:two-component system phosphate regulon sensor histidine kinase PhoR